MNWSAEYCKGENLKPFVGGEFYVDFPKAPGHVNLIGRSWPAIKLRSTITIVYRIKGKGKFKALDPAPSPPGLKPNFRPMLFNDDWYDMNGRWWPTGVNCAFLAGDNEVRTYTIKIVPKFWSNVEGKQNGAAFKSFLKNVKRFYLAFSGGSSFSHGVSDGDARLEVISVKIK